MNALVIVTAFALAIAYLELRADPARVSLANDNRYGCHEALRELPFRLRPADWCARVIMKGVDRRGRRLRVAPER